MTATAPTVPSSSGSSGRRGSLFVPVLASAGIMVSLQQTIVVPLLPQFPRLLGVSVADASWIVTATLLAAAAATPVAGRLADMVGKRRVLLVCLGVLVVGSVVAALSHSLALLVVGRALQGLAVGVIPVGISLLRDHLPPARLGTATALMSASLGVGGALGLPLASFIAQSADWHVLFWGVGGIGVVITLLVLLLVPESDVRSGGRFDLVGALALTVALVCLLLAVSKGGAWGWTDVVTLTLFVVGALVMLGWGAWELRVAQPLIDLRVSRRRPLVLTNVASAVFGFAMFAMSLVFPQLLQMPVATGYGLGQSIVVAGLVMMPGGLCMIVMSPVSGRITTLRGPRTTLVVGTLVVAAGYLVAVFFHHSVWQLVVGSVIIASGIGLGYGAMPSLVMQSSPVSQTAAANSLNNLARAVGTSVSSAVVGVLLAQLTTSFGGAAVPSEGAFVLVLVLATGAALAALVITLFIPRSAAASVAQSAAPEPAGEASGPSAGTDGSEESVRTPGTGVDRPLVQGTVWDGAVPARGAVVTVVSTAGRHLGLARTGADGRYAVARSAPGEPHLLVLQWRGRVHAQHLAGLAREERDIDLASGAGVTMPGLASDPHREEVSR